MAVDIGDKGLSFADEKSSTLILGSLVEMRGVGVLASCDPSACRPHASYPVIGNRAMTERVHNCDTAVLQLIPETGFE